MSSMRIIKILDGLTLVQIQKERTLLEELEANELEVEYQCRQGFCGCCQLRLVEGEVEYPEEPIAFVRDGHILPCCCRLKSDITIELP